MRADIDWEGYGFNEKDFIIRKRVRVNILSDFSGQERMGVGGGRRVVGRWAGKGVLGHQYLLVSGATAVF